MKLHNDAKMFNDAVEATADALSLRRIFVEKDYWLTKALRHIAYSTMCEDVVFKGGTSLSKAYKLIERFSEDVDLALIPPDGGRSQNQTKKALRHLTTIASEGLIEDAEGSKKSSYIRKIYYTYPRITKKVHFEHISERLLIEANAFAQPFPSQKMSISSYIHDFFLSTKNNVYITKFALEPFTMNVLCLERTFTEKVMNLVKASHHYNNPVTALQNKVRHIYDIHQILLHQEIKKYVVSDAFFDMLEKVRFDDYHARVGDKTWMKYPLGQCLLFDNPEQCWEKIFTVYENAFKKLVYANDFPSSNDIVDTLVFLQERLREYDGFSTFLSKVP